MARKKGERRDTFLIESPAEREPPNRKEKKKKKKKNSAVSKPHCQIKKRKPRRVKKVRQNEKHGLNIF